jgi:hypothetical protein
MFYCSIFIHKHKICPPYSPFFTFSLLLSHLTGTHPWTGPVLFFCPSFFKCILIAQESFILVFQTSIYHALIKVTPSLLTLSLSL